MNCQTIKTIFTLSPEAQADITNLRYRSENDKTIDKRWEVNYELYRLFMETEQFDQEVDNFLDGLPEMELHNAIATLSYRLNSRGLSEYNQHWREIGKLSLSAGIMREYHKQTGRTEVYYPRGKNSEAFAKYEYFVGDASIEVAVKNSLAGITNDPAKARNRIPGKAGLKALKANSRNKETLQNGNDMQHSLATDVEFSKLYRYLLRGNEYKAIKEGKFLNGRKVGKIERKLLISERLRMTRERYRQDIANYKMLLKNQEDTNAPFYLEMKYDYRGRVYYVNNNLLLGPQTKIGKKMWQSYKPRVLNELDYYYIAFIVMSTLERCNPDNAVALFEADIEGNIAKFLAEAGDYMEEVYHNRVVQAYKDYLSGTPNRTYLFTDYTNSGAIRFAAGLTREPIALKIANVLKSDKVSDPHAVITKAFNKIVKLPNKQKATRNDIKKAISQSITAGVSPRSAISRADEYFIGEYGVDPKITEEQYTKVLTDTYGKTGVLFHEFNKEMNSFYSNKKSELDIDTRDGFPARSIAYIKGFEAHIYYVSTAEDRTIDKKTGMANLKSMNISRDMPILYIIKDGNWTPSVSVTNRSVNGVKQAVSSVSKDKGGLANVTHADDAVAVRAKIDYLASVGGSGIFIHDNDGTCGMLQHALLEVGQNDLVDSFEKQPFLMALRSAAKGTTRTINGDRFIAGKLVSRLVPGKNFMQA